MRDRYRPGMGFCASTAALSFEVDHVGKWTWRKCEAFCNLGLLRRIRMLDFASMKIVDICGHMWKEGRSVRFGIIDGKCPDLVVRGNGLTTSSFDHTTKSATKLTVDSIQCILSFAAPHLLATSKLLQMFMQANFSPVNA